MAALKNSSLIRLSFTFLFTIVSCKTSHSASQLQEESTVQDNTRNPISGLADNEDLVITMTSAKKGDLEDGFGGVEVYLFSQVFIHGRKADQYGDLKTDWGTEEFMKVGTTSDVSLKETGTTHTNLKLTLKGAKLNRRIRKNKGANKIIEVSASIYEDDLISDNHVTGKPLDVKDILEIANTKSKSKELTVRDTESTAEFTLKFEIKTLVNK